jgi:hypothetical protein
LRPLENSKKKKKSERSAGTSNLRNPRKGALGRARSVERGREKSKKVWDESGASVEGSGGQYLDLEKIKY